jgi:FixJ family two-component response regulator
MLTSYTDEEAMLEAILAGAGGYVIKDIKGMELLSAVRTVGAGRSLLDNQAAAALMGRLRASVAKPGSVAGLTGQERTRLDLIGEGLTNRQTAERMFLAEKTVKNSRAGTPPKKSNAATWHAVQARWSMVSTRRTNTCRDAGETITNAYTRRFLAVPESTHAPRCP